MVAEAPKGKNRRCSAQPWVSGLPTLSTERLWVLRDGLPSLVAGRGGLSGSPETVVVCPPDLIPDPQWFADPSAVPESVWVGSSSSGLARGGTSRRHGAVLAAQTVSRYPHLGNRLPDGLASSRPLTVARVRPVLDLAVDAPTAAAVGHLSRAVRDAGGRLIIVGGAVRDMVLARASGRELSLKDVDVEVYGMPAERVRALVAAHYAVDETGAAFAVLKAHVPGTDHPIDVALPRRESATGRGHRDFSVQADPSLTFAEAAYRRDFTIGAMGYDPLADEIIDPYGGLADLAAGVLRHVSDAFDEDPLRALRAARFAARFGLSIHPETMTRCRDLRSAALELPVERRWGEIDQTLDQAPTPGRALRALEDMGWIDVFAPLDALRAVPQDASWHPEGDVLEHTAAVLDYWGRHLRTGNHDDDRLVAVAAMCHDLGKITTTQDHDGRVRSLGHEAAGVPLAADLLRGYNQLALADDVAPLIAHHLAPVQLADSSDRALRRLSTKVPRLDLLALVARADQAGRPPRDPAPAFAVIQRFSDRVAALGLAAGPPSRLLTGRHLIEAGLTPGPVFSQILSAAYEAQLDGLIASEADARAFLARRPEVQ